MEEVRAGADSAETGEAPIFEEGSEGIRMMSVHKAKGLEFPVVILADITAKICQSHPSRYIDSSFLCVPSHWLGARRSISGSTVNSSWRGTGLKGFD